MTNEHQPVACNTQICPLVVPEAKSPNQVSRLTFPLKALGGHPSLPPLPASGDSRCPLAYLPHSNLCLCLHTAFFSSRHGSLMRTSLVFGFRTHLMIKMLSSQCPQPAKTFLPSKVTFTGSQAETQAYLLGATTEGTTNTYVVRSRCS